jgi:hypothetical protein
MATRTVRLDPESERILSEIQEATGMPVSRVLKRGLIALRESLRAEGAEDPFRIYEDLDLGPGGYAVAAARQAKHAIRTVLAKKRRR